jgi:hypothetical protein
MDLDAAIDALATTEEFPAEAISWALDHWEHVHPRAATMLAAYLSGADRSVDAENALFFLLHIGAEKSDTSLYPNLCRLACDQDASDLVLGDAVIETLPRLLISTFNGDPAPMLKIVETEDADPHARASILTALAWLTHDGKLTQTWMQDTLRRLFETMQPRRESAVWVDWATSVAALGYTEFVPDVEDLFKREWIHGDYLSAEAFQDDLRDTLEDPEGAPVFGRNLVGPFTDTIGALKRWNFAPATEDKDLDEGWISYGHSPYVNPLRDVGRNDPCPCGSGKKYKKCCLAD